MKYIWSFLVLAALLQSAGAIEITRGVAEAPEKISVGNINVVSPTDIAKSERSFERELLYMMTHYSDAELRRLAVSLNRHEILIAKKNNQVPPEKLDDSVLSNREKIADYIRSIHQYKY